MEDKNTERHFITFYGEYSLYHWITMILKKEIILPDFQRRFVWDPLRVMKLMRSINEGVFIPPVLIARYSGKSDILQDKEKMINGNYVLDGQQRLSSILLAYFGLFPKNYTMVNETAEYAWTFRRIQETFEKCGNDIFKLKSELEKTQEYCSFDENLIKELRLKNIRIKHFNILKNINIDENFLKSKFLGYSYIKSVVSDFELEEKAKEIKKKREEIKKYKDKIKENDNRIEILERLPDYKSISEYKQCHGDNVSSQKTIDELNGSISKLENFLNKEQQIQKDLFANIFKGINSASSSVKLSNDETRKALYSISAEKQGFFEPEFAEQIKIDKDKIDLAKYLAFLSETYQINKDKDKVDDIDTDYIAYGYGRIIEDYIMNYAESVIRCDDKEGESDDEDSVDFGQWSKIFPDYKSDYKKLDNILSEYKIYTEFPNGAAADIALFGLFYWVLFKKADVKLPNNINQKLKEAYEQHKNKYEDRYLSGIILIRERIKLSIKLYYTLMENR